MKIPVSVIVPVYNTQKTLNRCLDSIVSQTFSDFEAIVIDDGSTDSSSKICDEYAFKDKRFKVFHTLNAGVSSARNLGIDLARGDWLCFIDSDDFVQPNYLENLIVNTKDVQLVVSGLKRISQKNTTLVEFPDKIVEIEDKIFYLQQYPLSDMGYPVSKLFKKEVLRDNSIKFDIQVHMFEDVIFLFTYLLHCKRINFTSQTAYNYMLENSMLSLKINDFKKEYFGFMSLYKLVTEEHGISHYELLNQYTALGFRISRLMNRCISILYLKNYPSSFCLKALENFPEDTWVLFKKFIFPENSIKRIVKFLLINKYFKASNLILKLSYRLKR
ncbi:MAG: glycosyltransferase family 2 protein [Mongoliitalea sp.]